MASEFWPVRRKCVVLVTVIAFTTITITSAQPGSPETCRPESPPVTQTEDAAIINKTYMGTASCNSIFTYSYNFNYLRSELEAGNPPKLVVHAFVGNQTHPDQPLVISVQHKYSTKVMILPYSFDEVEDESLTLDNRNRTYFYWSNHTLCFLNHQYSHSSTSDLRTYNSYKVNITIDTPSATGIKFNLSLNEAPDEMRLRMGASHSHTFSVSPMAATYFTYTDWGPSTPKNEEIELHFSSTGVGDRICTLLGADEPSCPVYDSEATIAKLNEKKQVLSSGVLRLRKSDYRDRRGLQIIIIPLANDAECVGDSDKDNNSEKVGNGVWGNPDRLKNVTITIRKAKAQNGWILINFQLYILVICFPIALGIFLVFHCCILRKRYCPKPPEPPKQTSSSSSPRSAGASSETDILLAHAHPPPPPPPVPLAAAGSLMMYSDIVAADKRDARVAKEQDTSLLINVAFRISLVFMFPVTTLVYLYWQLMYVSGDYNLCYYNEKCRLRVDISDFEVADFNHVVSNLLYILFAIPFTGFVLWRRYNEQKYVNGDADADATPRPRPRGIVFALSAHLALALSLVTEGILGGVYHLCPRRTTSSYDFAAKYVIAVVMLSTIHQMRFRSGDHSGVVTFRVVTLFTVALPVFFWLEDISRWLYGGIAFSAHFIFISGYCLHLYYRGAVREETPAVDVQETIWHQDLYMGPGLHTLRHRLNSLWTCFTFCFDTFSVEPGRPNWINLMRRIFQCIMIVGNIAAIIAIIVFFCLGTYLAHLLLYALLVNVVVVLSYFSVWVIICAWHGGACAVRPANEEQPPIVGAGAAPALDTESDAPNPPNCTKRSCLLICACSLCFVSMVLPIIALITWGTSFAYLFVPFLIVFLILFVSFWVLMCWWHGTTFAAKNPPTVLQNMLEVEERSWIRKTRRAISLFLFFGNLVGSVVFLWPCQYDFAHWLLYLLAGNVVASLFFYSVWKLMYWWNESKSGIRDSIPFAIQPASFFLASIILWIWGFCCFNQELIDWSKTPAQSRELNEECYQIFGLESVDYYDQQSFWHFCSAAAIFFSFMGLLTIDDGVFGEEHDNIPVF